ncbi:MAG: hypothetical protein E7624_06300 [Ruminococcaceae bacterium]|nr:hypothetical protein [Oscillospiraceae bacterium]
MKRIFTLLLAVLLLTSLVSCSKEEPTYGTFYVENGIMQNTSVTLRLKEDTFVAPVTDLEYVLSDNGDFGVNLDEGRRMNTAVEDVLEVYGGNGHWSLAAIEDDYNGEMGYSWERGDPTARREHTLKMRFVEKKSGEAGYRYLEPGFYRVRVKYSLYTDDESVYIPEEQLEAVAYFTVVAPTE